MKKIVFLIALLLTTGLAISFCSGYFSTQLKTDMLANSHTDNTNDWVQEQFSRMTLEEKIAQLMMIRISSNYNAQVLDSVIRSIEKYQPGGVCFFQGGPIREINITNKIQSVSKIPLLVAIDGEWGAAMRLDSCSIFPRQMTLGAIDSRYDSLIYNMGYAIGKQCRSLGIMLNFAPAIDINSNSKNPVINSRSFGENRAQVVQKATAYMTGMQAAGLITCIKHFPGHGDSETDSHKSLPIINKSRQELDSMELYPFRQLIHAGADMVMVGHLNVPALDNGKQSIATLSPKIIDNLLKKEMQFKGIVITDAMEMKGLRNQYPDNGEAEILALLAGNDMLLLPGSLHIVIAAIKQAVESGRIEKQTIDERCLKILRLKQKYGLTQFSKIASTNIYEQVNGWQNDTLIKLLESKALTLLKNADGLLPLHPDEKDKIALFAIGGGKDTTLLKIIAQRWGIGFVSADRNIKKEAYARLDRQLQKYTTLIVAILGTNQSIQHRYGITDESLDYLKRIPSTKKMVLSINANPYSTPRFGSLNNYNAVIIAYQPDLTTVETTLEAIFGRHPFEGRLPVSIPNFDASFGITLSLNDLGIINNNLSLIQDKFDKKIDSFIYNAIHQQIIPGCQIIAAENGRLIFSKAYGNLTYDSVNPQPVTMQTVYDIASITKVAATTLALMKLYDEGRFELTDPIGKYLPSLQTSDKKNITIRELLTHTSGLKSYIPVYKSITIDTDLQKRILNPVKNDEYRVEIAANLFLHKEYKNEFLNIIIQSPLEKKAYVYSDLNFVLLKEMVENLSEMPLDYYVETFFYEPMRLTSCHFLPLQHNIDKRWIAPTEKDDSFRKQTLQGYVHDQTAALFGGVSGNAGLFCSANDLVQIFQMLLNGGVYNGKRYLSEKTVKLFVSPYPLHNCKRRGLGFDTPENGEKSALLPVEASQYTFGHLGFTGTSVWCDPDHKMIYVFLSNRVYPNVEPNKLAKSKLRQQIHDVLYQNVQ